MTPKSVLGTSSANGARKDHILQHPQKCPRIQDQNPASRRAALQTLGSPISGPGSHTPTPKNQRERGLTFRASLSFLKMFPSLVPEPTKSSDFKKLLLPASKTLGQRRFSRIFHTCWWDTNSSGALLHRGHITTSSLICPKRSWSSSDSPCKFSRRR